jgi:ATP-dependent phosphofructokinase / diphosphate-dependent phosphofructokinase
MRIGILTGGGDVPGLNPCIQQLTLQAAERGWTALGFRQGWQGVLALDPLTAAQDAEARARWTIDLTPERVRGIDRMGGTILHTSRCDPRHQPEGDRTDHVRGVLAALDINAMVTLGGDGTLRFSAHLAQLGVPVIAIPKTMDNDVAGTDYCLGFSTAITRSVDAINTLRSTVASHERIGVVELFGRRSGETARLAGFLARADRTVIAEIEAEPDVLLPLLERDYRSNPERYAMVVVSEGARIQGDTAADELNLASTQRKDQGPGLRLARLIEERLNIATVVQELAYLMRSGPPDALDRMVGFAFGAMAAQQLAKGDMNKLITVQGGTYAAAPIDRLLISTKTIDIQTVFDTNTCRARIRDIAGLPMFLS